MKKLRLFIGVAMSAAVTLVSSSNALAIPIDPAYTTFGQAPAGVTWGGSGIPTDSAANTVINSGNYTIQIGMTATPRFSSPSVQNNGAGVFGAQAGAYPGNPAYGLWNFNYYANFTPDVADGNLEGYSMRLYFDKNPAVGNDVTTSLLLEPSILVGSGGFDSQNSWNLGMSSFLGTGYDPTVYGQYDFALVVYKDGGEIGRSAIEVNVNADGSVPSSVPDGGSTAALAGLAFAGIAGFKRFKKA